MPILNKFLIAGVIALPVISHAEIIGTVESIRNAATSSNWSVEAGRALPLATRWSGKFIYEDIRLIEQGHYIMPSISSFLKVDAENSYYQIQKDKYLAPLKEAVQKCGDLDIPLNIIMGNVQDVILNEMCSPDLAESNPCDYNFTNENLGLSPIGSEGQLEHWRQAGERWGSYSVMKDIQSWMPDPTKILIVQNNESNRVNWTEIESSQRYDDYVTSGILNPPTDEAQKDDYLRRITSDGHAQRFLASNSAMKDAFTQPAWADTSRVSMIGYNEFGKEFMGRWHGWMDYATPTAYGDPDYSIPMGETWSRMGVYSKAWDGGSPSYYFDFDQIMHDDNTMSPQIAFMNSLFMKQEAYRYNPEFWYEISAFDGMNCAQFPCQKQIDIDNEYSPERYLGYIQFGLWLTTPRAVRDFNLAGNDPRDSQEYFLEIVKAVDRVHNNSTLQRFWKYGELVENRLESHPFNKNLHPEYTDEKIREKFGIGRWFLLDADVNPSRPWDMNARPLQKIPVFSIAYKIDNPDGSKEWLIYSHAPAGEQNNVTVDLPINEEEAIAVYLPSVSVAGNFYLVGESGSANEILFIEGDRHLKIFNSDDVVDGIPDHAATGYILAAPGETVELTAVEYDGYGKPSIAQAIWIYEDVYLTTTPVSNITWIAPQTPGEYSIRVETANGIATFQVNVSNLVAKWDFEGSDSLVATDNSGHKNHAALIGDPQRVTQSNTNQVLKVNAENKQYIECAHCNGVNITGELTVSARIKLAEIPESSWQWIVSNGNFQGEGTGYALGLWAGKVYAKIGLGSQFDPSSQSNPKYISVPVSERLEANGDWVTISLVFKPGEYIKVYFDGELKAEAYSDALEIPSALSYGESGVLTVGKLSYVGSGFFNGYIDDVTIYNKALSSTELQHISGQ